MVEVMGAIGWAIICVWCYLAFRRQRRKAPAPQPYIPPELPQLSTPPVLPAKTPLTHELDGPIVQCLGMLEDIKFHAPGHVVTCNRQGRVFQYVQWADGRYGWQELFRAH